MAVSEKLKGFILRTFSNYGYAVGVRKTEGLPLEKMSMKKYRWLRPTFRYWYADPMVRHIRGKYYVFTEQFDLDEGKGKIAVSEIRNGKIGMPKTILDEPFHLSFPNVFAFGQDYYMVPECSASHAIRIYKMGGSVEHWEEILSIPVDNCVDTAVLQQENGIYLISSELEKDNALKARKLVIHLPDFPRGAPCVFNNSGAEYSLEARNGGDLLWKDGAGYCVNQVSTPTAYGQYMDILSFRLKEDGTLTQKKVNTIRKEDIKSPKLTYPLLLKMDTHTYSVSEDMAYEAVDIGCTYFSVGNLIRNRLWKRRK